MRFAGIDIASETHVLAIADGAVEVKATRRCRRCSPARSPWRPPVTAEPVRRAGRGRLSPCTDQSAAHPSLRRRGHDAHKTDAIDALGIARFAAQKRPSVAPLPDALTEELRELVRLRQRLLQDFGDRVRQLHRLVDLGFPEFTRYVRTLDSELASAILRAYPTAAAFRGLSVKRLAALRYDERHPVGLELARTLIDAARRSVGQHHSPAYRLQIRYACDDLDVLRRRLRELDRDLDDTLRQHEIARLLLTIDGIGPHTAAYVIAEVGNPAHFKSPAAFAAYVGAIPGLKQSGKRSPNRAALTTIGNARLRAALWMPTLAAVRFNPWLRTHYLRLRARGKLPKVALVACMHKLLFAIYSVAKHRRAFVPQLAAPGTVQ